MSAYSIILNVTGKNNASSILKNAAKEIKSLGTEGSKVGSNISKGMAPAQKSVEKVGTTASSTGKKLGTMGTEGAKAGSNITKSMSGASNAMGGMGDILTSLAAGYGAMTLAQAAWTGSTQAQFNKAYLATKVGTKAADEYVKSIQTIVAEVPGDDTFMNQILTGAVAKQTNISNTELKALGNGVADYLAVSKSMGKSNIETQNDLNEYIKTGNTSQLERDSILKNQMGTLEGQGTVSERILALNTALKAEGYAGLSQLDIASIKAEELKGKFQLTATEMGTRILPYAERFLDFMLGLDKATKGQSTMWLLIAGGVLAVGVAMAPLVWSMKQVSGGLKDAVGSASSLSSKIKDFILPSKKKVKIECDRDKDCNTGGTTAGGKSSKSGKNSNSGSTIFGGLSGVGKAGVLLNGIAIPGIATILAGNAFADSGARTTSLNSKGQLETKATKTASDYTWTPGGKKVGGSKEPIISDKKVMDFLNSINPFKGTSANKKTNANTGSMDITKGLNLGSIKWPNAGQILGSIIGILQKGMIIPKINWPNVASIGRWIIAKIPKMPKINVPTIGSIGRWIQSKIPKMPNWRIPTLGSIGRWVQSKIPSMPKMRVPSLGSVSSWIKGKIPSLKWPSMPSAGTIAGWIQRAAQSLAPGGPRGPGNARGPSLSTNIINTARGPIDHLKNAMSGFGYEDYAGHQKSIAQVLKDGKANCVDLTLTQMALGSGMGLNMGMASTTWNGGNHVLGTIGSSPMDVANHALTGSWSSPPRGPGDNNSNGDTYIINGDVYGWEDFVRKVEHATDQIIGNNLTL